MATIPGSPVKRKLLLLLALVLSASIVGVPAVNAYEPASGATFNVPRPWGSDAEKYRLVRKVEEAIRRTPGPTAHDPEPTIMVATFLFDRRQSVDALIDACRRGVSVRVIMDGDVDTRVAKRLVAKLNGDNVTDDNHDGKPDSRPRTGRCGRPLHQGKQAALRTRTRPLSGPSLRASLAAPSADEVTWGKDKSYVKKCSGSCRGAGGNMHTKFYLFNRTGSARNVVIVSSSNLNAGGAVRGWNDMWTMKGRPKSYAAYAAIHREMTDDKRAGTGKVEVVDGPFTSRFFPMRNAGKRRDPTMQDLNKVRCTSSLGRTQINVSMFYWAGTRGNYIATKLLSLARNGCHVSIIYGAPSVQIAERLRTAAGNGLIDLWDSRWDFDHNHEVDVRTHAKYFLVKGTYAGDRSARLVSTGSQNWVAGSLSKGDENTLNIRLAGAYAAYMRDWNMIRNHSRKLPYH